MSYCSRQLDGAFDEAAYLAQLKDYLNLDPNDTSFDKQLELYFNAALTYLENVYNIILKPGIFTCIYNKDYFERSKYNIENQIEIILPKPVNNINFIQYTKTGFGEGLLQPITTYENIPYLLDKNIIRLPYWSSYQIIPYFWHYWNSTKSIVVECNLGYNQIPADLLLVLFQMSGEMYSKKALCDCSKICDNDSNSNILSGYTDIQII